MPCDCETGLRMTWPDVTLGLTEYIHGQSSKILSQLDQLQRWQWHGIRGSFCQLSRVVPFFGGASSTDLPSAGCHILTAPDTGVVALLLAECWVRRMSARNVFAAALSALQTSRFLHVVCCGPLGYESCTDDRKLKNMTELPEMMV